VFKYGKRQGLVNFDYTDAWCNLRPWQADLKNFCARSRDSRLVEFPIYCEPRWIGAFLTPQRIYRAVLSRMHKFDAAPAKDRVAPSPGGLGRMKRFCRILSPQRRYAWKADFNQCTGRQLIGALKRAEAAHPRNSAPLPFVLIGHSKLFTHYNQRNLRPFLAFVAGRPTRFGFGLYHDFDLKLVGEASAPELHFESKRGEVS
jgi:hypothetical protein